MTPQLADAITRLQAAGIDTAPREVRWLLQKALGQDTETMLPLPKDPLSPAQKARFEALIERRAAREPLQHILGEADFMDLVLKTDSRALVPRWDSESVVQLALEQLTDGKPATIADLGTGSGALLAAILKHRSAAHGIAVEQSSDALSLAAENFTALGLSSRITLFEGSWTSWNDWGACDLIISNPPYIASKVIDTLAPEVRDHDPREALDGGPDGLDAYRQIIALGAQQMRPGAHLVLEIGFDQKNSVSDLLKKARFSGLIYQKDIARNDRAIGATKG